MESQVLTRVQALDEDLQMVRATLATIAGDVHYFSEEAGYAIMDALEKLNRAQEKISRLADC